MEVGAQCCWRCAFCRKSIAINLRGVILAINIVDVKILWGRAGGRCSKPDCGEDLTTLVERGSYVVGEMAHVIGSKPNAARGTPEGGSDTYDNLILLCPNHHTHIDKAPEGTYPVEMLHEWKKAHEEVICNAGKTIKYESYEQLRISIARILASNKAIFDSFEPLSTNPINLSLQTVAL